MGNNAKVGGILSIVSGVFGFIGGGFYILMIYMFNFMLTMPQTQYPMTPEFPQEMFQMMAIIYGGIGLMFALIGALAIVGGVYAIKKKNWVLALAGAIASTVTFFPCGIPAVIFVSLGKEEFTAGEPPA
ncbi:MAG: hypothetical protein HQ588_02205 [Deltaproteobacteria bacterium]|nr:hypothetical protein [Deltaproteobacteria bacterium]